MGTTLEVPRERLEAMVAAQMSYRAMAAEIGCHYNTAKKLVERAGLSAGIPKAPPPEPVDDLHSKCSKCQAVTRNDDFPYVINRNDGRRLSYCRRCRYQQSRQNMGADAERYWRYRTNQLKVRAAKSGIPFNLGPDYLLTLWERQGGRCFYTDQALETVLATRAGVDRLRAPSVDKVMLENGYVVGNVVICSGRANSIKYDQSLAELAAWMPSWYARLCLCEWVDTAPLAGR